MLEDREIEQTKTFACNACVLFGITMELVEILIRASHSYQSVFVCDKKLSLFIKFSTKLSQPCRQCSFLSLKWICPFGVRTDERVNECASVNAHTHIVRK